MLSLNLRDGGRCDAGGAPLRELLGHDVFKRGSGRCGVLVSCARSSA